MEGRILTEKSTNEIKCLTILAFMLSLGAFVKENRLIPYLILCFILLALCFLYIKRNKLKLSSNILAIIIAMYNVGSIIYVIEYIRKSKAFTLTSYLFNPFVGSGKGIYYIASILVFTTIMIFIYIAGGRNYGKEEQR